MKTVILIAGKMQSGKNTFAEMLKNELENKNKTVEFVSFAEPVKKQSMEDFNYLTECINKVLDDAEQKIENPYLLEKVKKSLDEIRVTKPEQWFEDKNILTRALLQTYGTDIFRNRIDDLYWIKKCNYEISSSQADVNIITDLRFKNELEFFKYRENENLKIISIYVDRETNERITTKTHSSEQAFNKHSKFDYIINNNKDLDELNELAKIVIKTEF